MSAASVPAPGTKYGPCKHDCAHVDCAASRRQAHDDCIFCGEFIGYEVPWYAMEDGPAHAVCAEEDADRLRAAARST